MGLFDKLIEKGSKVISEVASEENKEKASELLGKLKKGIDDVAAEVTSDENKEKAEALFGSLKEKVSGAAESIREAADQSGIFGENNNNTYDCDAVDSRSSMYTAGATSASLAADLGYDEAEACTPAICRERILSVLAQDFPQYTVRENVSPTTIGGTGRFMNYSIGVYDGDAPKLFMMIIGKTTTSHREYRWSREEAQKAGVAFINFIGHYPNRVEYIRQRLAKYL